MKTSIRKKKLAVKSLPREKKLPSAFPPRETMMSKSDKIRDLDERKIRDLDERVRERQMHSASYIYNRYRKQLDQLKVASLEIRKLKKKVDSLHATIGFLLTQ